MDSFTIQCLEGSVLKDHVVAPYPISVENLQKLYDRMSKFNVIFGRKLENIQDFVNIFLSYSYPHNDPQINGLFWSIDDLDTGLFYLTDISGAEATCHFAFFDARVAGREKLVWNMLKKGFDHFGFNRLNAYIPTYVKPRVHYFIRRCGVVAEGRKRGSAFYKGEFFDEIIYGIKYNDLLKLKDKFEDPSLIPKIE